MTIKKKVFVSNKSGLHARPASLIAETANKFDADIFLEYNGEKKNAKSILDIMTLAAEKGTKISLVASGKQAKEAIEAIEKLFKKKFDEE